MLCNNAEKLGKGKKFIIKKLKIKNNYPLKFDHLMIILISNCWLFKSTEILKIEIYKIDMSHHKYK